MGFFLRRISYPAIDSMTSCSLPTSRLPARCLHGAQAATPNVQPNASPPTIAATSSCHHSDACSSVDPMQAHQTDAGLTALTLKETCEATGQEQPHMTSGDSDQQAGGSGLSTRTACHGDFHKPDQTVSASDRIDKADRPSSQCSMCSNTSHLPSAELRRQVGVRWPAESFHVHIKKGF